MMQRCEYRFLNRLHFNLGGILPVLNKMTGTVKWFDMSKGYGYIEAGNGEEVFVHYQDIISNGLKTLLDGDRVEFAVRTKPSGPVALEVTRL